MTTYLVTSNRLDGLKRGDTVTDKDLEGCNIEHLIDAGHISTQQPKKSVKTKDTDTEKE
jgi:hypothetical protein